MSISKKYLVIIVLALGLNIKASTYYVSATGDDGNTGTNFNYPWQYCPGMPGWNGSATLNAGDTVFFNNSDTWMIQASSSALEPVGGVIYDGSTWGNGSRAIIRAEGNMGRGVITFRYDHQTIPTIVKGFEVDANNTISAGVVFNWGFAPSNLTGAIKRVEDCIVHDVYSLQSQGDYKYGIVISAWGGDTLSNVEVINCEVYNISRSGIVNYLGNDVPTNLSKNVIIRGCEVYNTGQDPQSVGDGITIKNHAMKTIVEYNYIHNTAGGGISITTHPVSGFNGPENAIVRYNIVSECLGRYSSAAVSIDQIGKKTADIYGNLFIKNNNSAIRFFDRIKDELSVRVYNNSCYQNCQSEGNREILIQCHDADISVLEIKNNIIYARSTIIPLIDNYGDIASHSNNLYFRTGGGTLVMAEDVNYNASNLISWESTALTTDPLFNNPDSLPTGFDGTYGINIKPNTEGLNITFSSPARDTGDSLDIVFSGSINSIMRPSGNRWDRGAYEYNDVNTIKTNSKIPEFFLLGQNYPNPFNPITKINFQLPEYQKVKIIIYNTIGQKIVTLLDTNLPPGYHQLEFNAQNFASGLYYYCMQSSEYNNIKKMVLIK